MLLSLVLASTVLYNANSHKINEMPTVSPKAFMWYSDHLPIEKRDASVQKYLKCSFRIENRQGRGSVYGSGTLCYYDSKTNTGYVISCGHLFSGGETQVGIDVFYKNAQKLPRSERFTAEVICFSKRDDISFVKFTPNWVPDEFFPIASLGMSPITGDKLISTGCDHAKEVAAYDVTVMGTEGRDLITKENSPRHGRSGGGLINKNGYFVGICWGSSDPDYGTGTGLFVPLSRIHNYAKSQNLAWLLNIEKPPPVDIKRVFIDQIPIVDHTEPQKVYPKGYVPIP